MCVHECVSMSVCIHWSIVHVGVALTLTDLHHLMQSADKIVSQMLETFALPSL